MKHCLDIVLFCFSVTVINTTLKAAWVRKGLFRPSAAGSHFIPWKFGPGTGNTDHRAHCSLSCSQVHVQLLYYIAQTHLPEDGTAHNGPGTNVSNQENAPTVYRPVI